MSLQYKKVLIFIIAGLTYLAGQYFRGVWFADFTWPLPCHRVFFGATSYCDPQYLDTLGFPLIALGQMLFIVAFVLLLTDAKTFHKWLKFSAFYVPIAVLLDLWIYPIRFVPNTPILTYSQGVYPFGWLYVILTLGVVLKGLHKRGHNETT